METRTRVPVRRRLPRSAVLATALSVILLVALLTELRASDESTLVPVPDAGVSPAAGGSCPLLDPADRDLRVLFVGDSMTQGRSGSATYRYWVWRGLTDPVSDGGAGRDDVDVVGPRVVLNGDAGAATYEHLDHGFADERSHAAQAGATYDSSRADLPPKRLARDHRPDVVVLQLGYNDANRRRTTPEQLASRFGGYMEAMWSEAPDTRFVLGQIPPAEGTDDTAADTADRNRRTAAANDLLAERWGDEPCRVQVNELRTSTSPTWDPEVHTYDGAHPDPAGETLMAQRMLDAMGRLGVFAGEVRVYDPEEPWDPSPRPTATATDDGRVRVEWAGEQERLSATTLRLLVGPPGEQRQTPWYTDDEILLDLGPGRQEIRAVVGRGLPGRMVSEPGEPVVVDVPD